MGAVNSPLVNPLTPPIDLAQPKTFETAIFALG